MCSLCVASLGSKKVVESGGENTKIDTWSRFYLPP